MLHFSFSFSFAPFLFLRSFREKKFAVVAAVCHHRDIVLQLGVVLLEQGKASQALAYLDKALEIDPEHGQALLNSAILLQEFGRPELRSIARERLLKLLVMDGK